MDKFQKPFSQFFPNSQSVPNPTLPTHVPFQIIDHDDISIANLISRKSRSQPKRKNSFSPIVVEDHNLTEPHLFVPSPRTPHTCQKKQQENASLAEALQASKRKHVVTPAPPLSFSQDVLLRFMRKDPYFELDEISANLDSHTDYVLPFQKRKLDRGRVVTSFEGLEMGVLLTKLEAQEWSHLFLQGDLQRKFEKTEVYEFYTNGVAIGEMFSTTFRGVTINIVAADIARILNIPMRGLGHYIKVTWPPLDNIASALDISQKFSGNPHLQIHRRVLKREITPLYELYFDVVHKMITPKKERRTVANFLDLNLMEFLDTEVQIDPPRLIIQHMQRVLLKDINGHALPYELWLAPIFDDFLVHVQVWSLQITKDVIGTVNQMKLLVSMRIVDNPMQRLRNALAAKTAKLETVQAELESAQVAHAAEKLELLA
ncbi:hypothetical protein P3S67_026743 [Capsicum chacoense]